MPEPFEDLPETRDGAFSVEPTRIGRGSRRSAWAIRIAFVAIGALVAWAAFGSIDDEPAVRPSLPPVADASPSLAPAPPNEIPTTLPTADVRRPEVRGGPLPLVDRALALLDPETGFRGPDLFSPGPNGFVFTDRQGWIVCLCLDEPWIPAGSRVAGRVVRANPLTGRVEAGDLALRLLARPSPREFGVPIRLGAALTPDGSRLVVASVRVEDGTWIVAAHVLATHGGELLESQVLATYPAPTRRAGGRSVEPDSSPSAPAPDSSPSAPAPDSSPSGSATTLDPGLQPSTVVLARPIVAASPDGRTIRVSVLHQPSDDGQPTAPVWERDAWNLGLVDDAELELMPLAAAVIAAGESCPWEGWATPDRYVRVCEHTIADRQELTEAVLERADGREVRRVPLSVSRYPGYAAPLVDQSSGAMFVWSPYRHVLVRLDAATGETTVADVGVGDGRGSVSAGTGIRPRLGDGSAWWTSFAAPTDRIVDAVAGSVDGSLVFAAGGSIVDRSDPAPASTGVWVFDAATGELVEQWEPAAAYVSVAVGPDGRELLALGAEGIDPSGAEADWGTSLSVHDLRSGVLLAQYGDVARGYRVRLVQAGVGDLHG